METPNELWQHCLSLTRVTAHWHKSRKGALEAEIGAAQTPNDLQRAKRDVERFVEEMEQRHRELGEIAMEVERAYAQVRPKKPGLGRGGISGTEIEQEKAKVLGLVESHAVILQASIILWNRQLIDIEKQIESQPADSNSEY